MPEHVTDGTYVLGFALICIGLIVVTLAAIALSKLPRFGDAPLPPPDRRCERLASEHWRAGRAVTGWRP